MDRVLDENMEGLGLNSDVSDGSCGGKLNSLPSQNSDLSCSSDSPKFMSLEESVTHDFPDSLSGFGRNIEQEANDDHDCDQDYVSCEPDTDSACDFEHDDVESESEGPVTSSSEFSDEEFVDLPFEANEEFFNLLFEAKDPAYPDAIDSMRFQITVNVEVGGYPLLENTLSGSNTDSVTSPYKRRKVSAVRDFPEAFQQLKKESAVLDLPDAFQPSNGQITSQEKGFIAFGDPNGASDFDDDPEPTNTDDFETNDQ